MGFFKRVGDGDFLADLDPILSQGRSVNYEAVAVHKPNFVADNRAFEGGFFDLPKQAVVSLRRLSPVSFRRFQA